MFIDFMITLFVVLGVLWFLYSLKYDTVRCEYNALRFLNSFLGFCPHSVYEYKVVSYKQESKPIVEYQIRCANCHKSFGLIVVDVDSIVDTNLSTVVDDKWRLMTNIEFDFLEKNNELWRKHKRHM